MKSRRSGAVKPIPIFVGVVVVLAVACAFGSKAIIEAASVRKERQEQEKQSARGVIDAVERMTEGKEVAGGQKFPDTPQGRMTKLVFSLVLSEQDRQKKLEEGLKEIDWDWVMTPESLRTKENVQECLNRLAKAGVVMENYSKSLEDAWTEMLAKMEVEAKTSPESQKFLEGFKKTSSQPGGGLFFARKIRAKLRENHEALGASLRFLLARSGKYTVTEAGEISFSASVSKKEQANYDGLIDKVNSSLEEVQKLEEMRLQTARSRIDQAKDYLK